MMAIMLNLSFNLTVLSQLVSEPKYTSGGTDVIILQIFKIKNEFLGYKENRFSHALRLNPY